MGSHTTLWSRGLVRSRVKIRPLYFHNQSVYGYQTWQNGNLPWWARAYKLTLPFDHVILWDQVINYSYHIFTTTVPMPTKLGKRVTYIDGFLPMKLHDSSITWSCEILWQPKIILSLLPQYLLTLNLISWWLAMKGFHLWCYSTLWPRVLRDHVTN